MPDAGCWHRRREKAVRQYVLTALRRKSDKNLKNAPRLVSRTKIYASTFLTRMTLETKQFASAENLSPDESLSVRHKILLRDLHLPFTNSIKKF